MAHNCENCKFYDVDYEWDDELEDEFEIKTCERGHEFPCDNDFDCPDFKEYKPKPYKEEFSECDYCQYVSSCGNVIESTTKYDMKRHFVRGVGGYCRKESGDFVDKKLSEIIEMADKSNDPQLKSSKELLQKAIERFGDITYKEFIKDKLYKMYHL